MSPTHMPVLNLLNQFLKQVSGPMSSRIVEYAKAHPVFRRYFLVLPGRWFHAVDLKIRKDVLENKRGKEKRGKDRRVDDDTAIDVGAKLMSEGIIFLIAGLGVMAEVTRSGRNSASRDKVKREQMEKLIGKKDEISLALEKQAHMINKLEKLVDEYTGLTAKTASPEDGKKNE
ncbi:OPA3-like protein [Athalia rosae]|uniref:OPA3-like protein n=1 Tax=Athalia rosae TaxID=37344 RepID=UPI002033C04A|nr:OPA3-like protein [Athalia rosae]